MFVYSFAYVLFHPTRFQNFWNQKKDFDSVHSAVCRALWFRFRSHTRDRPGRTNHIYVLCWKWALHFNHIVYGTTLGTKKWALFVLALYEAAGIRHNGLYSVNCVCIASRKHNGFRFPTSFYDRILLRFFYTIHSISVLGKEAKSWFNIKYSIHTHILVLLIKGCQFFRKCACDVTY